MFVQQIPPPTIFIICLLTVLLTLSALSPAERLFRRVRQMWLRRGLRK